MADRFPLIVDATEKKILELPSGDNLNLDGSSIVNVASITSSGGATFAGIVDAAGLTVNGSPVTVDLSAYDTSAEVDAKIAAITVDLSGYDTSLEVDNKLSNYDTSAEVDAKISAIPSVDLSGYDTSSQVDQKIADLVGTASSTLDTLGEIASALSDNQSVATSITTQLASKANTSALHTVALTGSYSDLSNKPNIPSVHNATITLKTHGSSAASSYNASSTFSLNQTNNETITLPQIDWGDLSGRPTIPTNTSDLNNDSGFITSAVFNGGNGGNAATLDGIAASQFLRSDTSDTSTQRIRFDANATNNWDTIATSSGSQGGLEVYNDGSGNDAFMTFHTGSDFACYFGLDADNNSLSVGGWSMGANKYKIWHSGNGGAESGLDADKLDGQQGSYYLDYSNFTNRPTIPTNNNQLSNGRGYQTEAEVNTLISAQITIPSSLKVGNDTIAQAYNSPDKQLQVGNIILFNDYGIKVTRGSDSDYILLGLNGNTAKYAVFANGATNIDIDFSNYTRGIRLNPQYSTEGNKSNITIYGSGSDDQALSISDGNADKINAYITHAGIGNFEGLNILGDINLNGIIAGRGGGEKVQNTAFGFTALENNTTGLYNGAFGYEALSENTVGKHNNAFGYESLKNNIDGEYNIAVGTRSLNLNTGGDFNVAIGYYSLYRANNSHRNTSIGAYSQRNARNNSTTGNSFNTSVGYASLYGPTTGTSGTENVALGAYSLYHTSSGNFNAAVGTNSLNELTIGSANTAVGQHSLRHNKAGSYSTAIGYSSQYWATETTTNFTTFNTSVGAFSMMATEGAPLIGTKNTAVGYAAGKEMNTGEENTAVGSSALNYNTEGSYNTAIGAFTLDSADAADFNTAVGCAALYATTTGDNNTAVGSSSFRLNKSGSGNCGLGLYSGYNTDSGSMNTAMGLDALFHNISGQENVAIGVAGGKGIRGSYNVAVGGFAMEASVDFDLSTAVGYFALNQCKGGMNTAVGGEALRYANGTGTTPGYEGQTENTAIGYGAGRGLTTAQYSTFLGAFAGDNSGNYNNCTYVGYNTVASGDNQIRLGYSGQTTYHYGIQNLSDLRDKTDIRDTILGLDFIKLLRPVDFRWDYRESYYDYEPETHERTSVPKDGSRKRNRFHHGLIAQEVKEVIDNTGNDFGGYQDHKVNGGEDQLTLGYEELIAPLIKAVQELSAENEALKARLDAAGL